MISGFNTDIEFDGSVYHVQTEDKGLSSRMIISLVYDGGTILASKRVGYDDIDTGIFDETKLTERVSRQHKLMCAAITAGRLGDLKEMTAKSSAAGAKAKAEVGIAAVEASPTSSIPVAPLRLAPAAKVETPFSAPVEVAVVEIQRVIRITPPDPLPDEPVIEAVEILEDDDILDAEAVEVVSELSGQERPTNTKLSLELTGETKLRGGDRRTLTVMICRGTDRKVVGDAQIMIKVLGSSFRPVIFHAKSDKNGLAKVHLQVPNFQAGRAAVLIRAMADGEEVELRRIVTPG